VTLSYQIAVYNYVYTEYPCRFHTHPGHVAGCFKPAAAADLFLEISQCLRCLRMNTTNTVEKTASYLTLHDVTLIHPMAVYHDYVFHIVIIMQPSISMNMQQLPSC